MTQDPKRINPTRCFSLYCTFPQCFSIFATSFMTHFARRKPTSRHLASCITGCSKRFNNWCLSWWMLPRRRLLIIMFKMSSTSSEQINVSLSRPNRTELNRTAIKQWNGPVRLRLPEKILKLPPPQAQLHLKMNPCNYNRWRWSGRNRQSQIICRQTRGDGM